MKTEKEISDKLKELMNTGSNSPNAEKILFGKIDLLLWILKCDDCKKYPCTCHEPF
jgi:hypothetical protein